MSNLIWPRNEKKNKNANSEYAVQSLYRKQLCPYFDLASERRYYCKNSNWQMLFVTEWYYLLLIMQPHYWTLLLNIICNA